MGIKITRTVVDDATGQPLEEDKALIVRLTMHVLQDPEAKPAEGEEEPAELSPVTYELYFATASRKKFEADMLKYTKDAQPVEVPEQRKGSSSSGKRDRSNDHITRGQKVWWRSLNATERLALKLPNPPETMRGRLPDTVLEAWDKMSTADQAKWVEAGAELPAGS